MAVTTVPIVFRFRKLASRGRWRKFVWPGSQLLAGLLLFGVLAGFIPVLRFVREKIVITLRPNEIFVEGLYYYRNPWPIRMSQGMIVPFPVDGSHPSPVDLSVGLLPGQHASLRRVYFAGQERFELYVAAHQTACVRVCYFQYAPNRDGRYILTTTQTWRRPLEVGEYRLVLQRVALKRSNYTLQPREVNYLGFERKEFIPDQDWEFAWSAL